MSDSPRVNEPLKSIDLFCGAGGMTSGFAETGAFLPVWANDFNASALATYRANFGEAHALEGDIEELLADPAVVVPPADVVIGGPPCQGFSLLNKKRAGDDRRRLWRPFLDVVRRSGARMFVMENVPQLLGTPEHDAIVEAAERLGFRTAAARLCAADFGVPQTRVRAFIVGCSFADPARHFPPPRTHLDPSKDPGSFLCRDLEGDAAGPRPWRTVRDAIADLPPPEGTEIRSDRQPLDLHFGRNPTAKSLARYRAVPEEGMNRFDLQARAPELTPGCWIRKRTGGTDLFGRLWWDRPAFTIRTEFFKPEKGRYLHPERHRPITHREAARLQSFPDDFLFLGTKIEIARQIGNAVPPLLASAVARSIRDCWVGELCSERAAAVYA
jgi:DNA (cytosine-5)-methyltransferase 1